MNFFVILKSDVTLIENNQHSSKEFVHNGSCCSSQFVMWLVPSIVKIWNAEFKTFKFIVETFWNIDTMSVSL